MLSTDTTNHIQTQELDISNNNKKSRTRTRISISQGFIILTFPHHSHITEEDILKRLEKYSNADMT